MRKEETLGLKIFKEAYEKIPLYLKWDERLLVIAHIRERDAKCWMKLKLV